MRRSKQTERGWRADAITDQECRHCWGTGRQIRYGRSRNCERGVHATCVGHQDPRRCGCFCHQDAAVAHGLLDSAAKFEQHLTGEEADGQ